MLDDLTKFAKHSFIYAIGNIANRLGGFILLPLYTNYLSTTQYGILEIFYSVNVIIASLLGFGFAHAALRFYFEYESIEKRKQVISTAFITIFIASTIGVLIIIAFRKYLSIALFDTIEYQSVITIGMAIVIAEISNQIAYAYYRAREKSILFVSITVGIMIIQVSCNIVTVKYLNLGVKGVLIGNLSAVGSAWIVSSIIIMKTCGVGISFNILKSLIRYSYPLLLGIVAGSVLTHADRFILKNLTSMDFVGIYGLAYKISAILVVIYLDAFEKNFGPYRFQIMKNINAKQIYSRLTTYMVFGALLIALALSIFSIDVLRLLSEEDFWKASELIPIICLGNVIAGLVYPFQTGIYIEKKTKFILYINIVSGISTVFFNFILVPSLKAYGSAVTIVVSSLVRCIITFFISQNILHVHYEFKKWTSAFLLCSSLFLLSKIFIFDSIMFSITFKLFLMFAFPVGLYFIKCLEVAEIDFVKRYFLNLQKRTVG